MTTKERGDIAIGFAISHFMSNHYEVCLPIGDKRRYDFVIEKDAKLARVQVKYAGIWKDNDKCMASLRTMGGNQSYYTAKKYEKGDFDILFVHTERGENYLFPWLEIEATSCLTIEHGKYKKYRV